jgi:hypothetical protein
MAGLLTAFSGFYTIYWSSPDNFTPFAVAADFALLFVALSVLEANRIYALAAGVCAGLAQLARADAAILLLVIPLLYFWRRSSRERRVTPMLFALVAAGAGFLIVLTPWLVRNVMVVGSPFAPGASRTLWLLHYDELFRYDTAALTPARYLDAGLATILGTKLEALGFVALVLLFGVWQIFLAPFAALGFWFTRQRAEMQAALIYLVLLVLSMAFVFTLPATHGSMLHSAAALVAFGAVAVPPGLDAAIAWLGRKRKWNLRQAQRFFRVGAVALAFFFSAYLYAGGVWLPPGAGAGTPLWNDRDSEYAAIDRELAVRGVPDALPILTVDPPSFLNRTGRRSIYLPTESTAAIFEAAHEFGADYLVLQFDKPQTLRGLYDGTETVDGLVLLATTQDALGHPVMLYQIRR